MTATKAVLEVRLMEDGALKVRAKGAALEKGAKVLAELEVPFAAAEAAIKHSAVRVQICGLFAYYYAGTEPETFSMGDNLGPLIQAMRPEIETKATRARAAK
ncbi:hypothetical protein HZA87_05395 [Candidatus Uhrbacteria bacterium]|nr:hypothetical protein [Candidatus Uhrbacteria bacterium]